MKLGTENKKKTGAAVALGAVALGLVSFELIPYFAGSGTATTSSTPIAAAPQVAGASDARPAARRSGRTGAAKPVINSLDPTIRLDLLDAAAKHHYQGSGRNIFEAYTPPPPKRKQQVVNTPPPVQVQQPVYVPAPINLKFYGWASKPGEPRRVFLSQGEEIYVAGEGQLVANRYKVVHITDTAVQIEDILNNNTQAVPIT
jgi:hypothetical protein